MKQLLSLVLLLSTTAVWAFDPIRINFNDKEKFHVDGWQDVGWAQASAGVVCANDVTMKVTGSKGWLYGGAYAIVTNKLQKLYIDDDGWQNPTVVRFDGLTKGVYSLKVYLSSDGSGEGVGAETYNPIEVNGVYYHYNSDGALVTGKDRWGDTAVKETIVGTNVLEIAQLTILGTNLTLSASRDWGRGGFAAIELLEYDYQPTPNVLSINVANSTLSSGCVPLDRLVPGLAGGDVPGYAWLNVSEVSNDFASVQYWNGETHQMDSGKGNIGVKVVAGGHYDAGSPSAENAFLQYYLDDNSAPSISVDNVPFKLYDVIVYLNSDWNNGSHKAFNKVKVNGVKYIWDEVSGAVVQSDGEWGARGYDTAILGTNALCVANQSASSLVVSTCGRYDPARGGFAAMQIVSHDYADIVASGDISTKEINKLAGEKKEVLLTLPTGATLTIDKKALNCDVVFVVSTGDVRIATWYNIAPQDRPQENAWYASNYAKINTTGVKGLVSRGWEPTKRILSVNFNSGKGEMPALWDADGGGVSGATIPSASWNNIPAAEDLDVADLMVWNGDALTTNSVPGLSLSATGLHYYQYGSSESIFRRGWIDAGNSTDRGPITFSGIPFERYDVIIYQIWDGTAAVPAPKVNGECWTWDSENAVAVKGDVAYGTTDYRLAAQLGVNAIRVPDQTGSTCVVAGRTGGNICAVQIVEYCPPVKEHRTGLVFLIR